MDSMKKTVVVAKLIALLGLLAACGGQQATSVPVTSVPAPSAIPTVLDYTPRTFSEREVTVGGEWALPGTLTVPGGAGPFPAVVLVHGSGPNDRDETLGPNKPFRDLAWGLADHGIAVLRYDKRTRVYGPKMAALTTLTLKEETVDDAVLAAALLRQQPEVNPDKVFVLGHSLGGMAIPRIGAADPALAGLIVMAGPTRPFADMIMEQVRYIANADGTISPAEQGQIDQLQTQVDAINDPTLDADTPAAQLLNVPAAYWLDLRGYQPAEAARSLAQPMLIMQGERDYQVTLDDLAGWRAALAGRENVTFKQYPALNHLFIAGSGPSTPAEYGTEGSVDPAAIDDIAAWIGEH
jgi:uncharacterized protein